MTVLRLEHRAGIWREPAPLRSVARLDCYPWLVVGTVCIGAFMGQVDASIAQLVLPEVEQDFHVSIGAAAWVSMRGMEQSPAPQQAAERPAEFRCRTAGHGSSATADLLKQSRAGWTQSLTAPDDQPRRSP